MCGFSLFNQILLNSFDVSNAFQDCIEVIYIVWNINVKSNTIIKHVWNVK